MQGTMPCAHAGKEDHTRPGWTTLRHGQDSPWKSQSECKRTGINGESMSAVWSTLESRTAKNRTELSQKNRCRTRRISEITCVWRTETVTNCCYVNRQILVYVFSNMFRRQQRVWVSDV